MTSRQGCRPKKHVVVLIRFDDEQGLPARVTKAQPWYLAANDVAGLASRSGEDVRDHGGGGGFAVGAGYSDDLTISGQRAQNIIAFDHGNAPGPGLLHFGVLRWHGRGDEEHIRALWCGFAH